MRILVTSLLLLTIPLGVASTEGFLEPQLNVSAMVKSDDGYDLRVLQVKPLTGLLLRMAAYAMTGNSFITKLVRSLVAKNMLNNMGASELKTFTGSLKTGRMKWPFYRPEKEKESSSQRPSQGEDLSAAPTRPYRSIEDIYRAYMERRERPMDVVEDVLKRAKALNEDFHFMVQFQDEEPLFRAATLSAQRYAQGKPLSKLDGIPFIVKDEMSVAGFQELVGTNPKDKKNPRIGKLATRNDPVIQALIDAGAILFGTSVMHEYGISPVGFNVWAQGPLNAYDPTRYTGGSSSGPATGVALGLFPFAIGFDGGGSIRDPSSWSGVVGTVATFGAVRYENAETEIFTTLHCGPITTNVADAAIVLDVMANTKNKGHHFYDKVYKDMFGIRMPSINFGPLYAQESRFTIGYHTAWSEDCAPEVKAMFYEVRDYIKSHQGWRIEPNFEMSHWNDQAISHTLTIGREFWQAHQNDVIDILEPNTKMSLDLGRELDDSITEATEKMKKWASEQWMKQFEKMDAVITPAMAIPAQTIQSGVKEYGLFNFTLVSIMSKYIWPSNLMGFPSVTVTIKTDPLPIGIQVICPPFKDGQCLAIAKEIEDHFAHQRKRPEVVVLEEAQTTTNKK